VADKPAGRGRPRRNTEEDRGPLAAVLRSYRRQRGWTQGQVAVYAGVSRSFISQMEQGRYKTAEPPTLQRIANALQAPLKVFLEAAGITDAPTYIVPELATPLPAIDPGDALLGQLLSIWAKLSLEDQRVGVAVLRTIWENHKERAPPP